MFQAGPTPANTTVIVQHRGQGGVLAGFLGCVFGLLGIFSWGLIFVPVAALCSLVGFVRGVGGRSPAGVGMSILAAMLCFWGFLVSPSLWALFAAGMIAQHVSAPAGSIHALNPAELAGQRAVQQERDFIAGLNAAVQRMDRFDNSVDTQLGKMPAVEQKYSSITTQMQAYLQRERTLVGNPNAGVARGQIVVAMSQASIVTDQLHNQVQQTQMSFDNEARPFLNLVNGYERACSGVQKFPENNSLAPAVQDRNAACLQFIDVEAKFKPKFRAFDQGLSHLEAVYQQESRVQEQLVNESTRIE